MRVIIPGCNQPRKKGRRMGKTMKTLAKFDWLGRASLIAALLVGLALGTHPTQAAQTATQIDIHGPAGSGYFGWGMVVLPNGNIVVVDPYYDAGGLADVGAVYLYDGRSGTQISALTGSRAGEKIGMGSWVTVLTNGNYVINSALWNGEMGASTWCSGTSGCSGIVSPSNSLVGSAHVVVLSNGNYVVGSEFGNGAAFTWCDGTEGCIGTISSSNSLVVNTGYDGTYSSYTIRALYNGNYVVGSPSWDNGAAIDAGAVTWCSGASGCIGEVSTSNSLVGSTGGDSIGGQDGFGSVFALSNGNYVVVSPYWDGAAADVGAVTWGNGATGITGTVSASNSLVASASDDRVGDSDFIALPNGDYVVVSPYWDGATANMGATTWGNGTTGITGTVSTSNSLVGSARVVVLSNGNYVALGGTWNGTATVGAVTWCSGTSGCAGVVSTSNSLVGRKSGDWISYVTALSNGNYVVSSMNWDGAATDVGAVTWGNGTIGITGTISTTNSLVGGTSGDKVGFVTALSNGNYVVCSPNWDGAAADVGAVTWGDGTTGVTGTVSASNSLVGSTSGDQVGTVDVDRKIAALSNGNYVVSSPSWDGAAADVGAATWGDGATGTIGTVSSSNSLVGSTSGDKIGNRVFALSNGNYVVSNRYWDGAAADVGAVTWGNGITGITGTVSYSNSLVGGTLNDHVGDIVTPLSNGNYVVNNRYWSNGGIIGSGAITLGAGWASFPTGGITASNSLLGAAFGGGGGQRFAFDSVNDQLVVARPDEDIVSLFKQPHTSIKSGQWGTDDTWDYGRPVARSDAVVDNGDVVNLADDAAIRNLTLTQGWLRLRAYNLTVDQSLNVNGTPGVERMVVADGGGALRKLFTGPGSFTFPLGDESGTPEYSPVMLHFTAGTFAAGAYVAAQVQNSKHPENNWDSFINRYWTVTQSGISAFTYDATFQYTLADVVGSESSLKGLKWDGSNWLTGSLVDTFSHQFGFNGLDSFSEFTAGSAPWVMAWPVMLR